MRTLEFGLAPIARESSPSQSERRELPIIVPMTETELCSEWSADRECPGSGTELETASVCPPSPLAL